eukprot:TRINITY_DN775_c0_g1_i4.p1 TRINITY_DN775_c0_g1~~TRINITY_DN775_c0_g1_i4.p1  ORF type:complete len:554 (+),score=150.14 TRINITY_DN775_c0_g1_i4:46-1707(+)
MLSRLLIGGALIASSSAIIAPPTGCAAMLCLEGTICVEDANGQGSCITNPCHVTDCPPPTTSCVVKDGQAVCVAPVVGCAAMLCAEGNICVEDANGQGSCITNPCHVTDCPPPTTSCVVKDGQAVCVAPVVGCAAMLCLEGTPPPTTSCVVKDGQAVCVAPVVGCAAMLCAEGNICVEDENGQGSCITNPCHVTDCPPPATSCVVKDGQAVCVAPVVGCAAMLCLEGMICVEDETGQGSCITNPCHVTDCPPPTTSCVVKDGKAVCVSPVVGCAAMLCAEGTDCEEDEDGQGHCVEQELDVNGYYLMKQDLRKCISPLCGGHWVSRVNKRRMRCADGLKAKSCYVAEITSDLKPHFTNNEMILVKGTPSKKDFGETFGTLGAFFLEETHVSSTTDEGFGKFFAVENSGVQCVTTPCPTMNWYVLNKKRSKGFSDIDFDARLGADAASVARGQLASGEAIIVAATTQRVSKGEKRLVVNQIYNSCPAGYLWHKEACRTPYGCVHPQLEMTLVGGVAPGGDEIGQPKNPVETTSCVDSCEDHQHTGPGRCTAFLQ